MRIAEVYMHGILAGILSEVAKNRDYQFKYDSGYNGPPVSVTMPVNKGEFRFDQFPPFFEGLLPEGTNLDMLLRSQKLDRDNLFEILLAVGGDTVGAVTVVEGQDETMPDHI
jgi:serine/threonine-protein kinase HipA